MGIIPTEHALPVLTVRPQDAAQNLSLLSGACHFGNNRR